MKSKSTKSEPRAKLRYIGLWATMWWAISGLYLVYVIWVARIDYVASSAAAGFSLDGWYHAIIQAGKDYNLIGQLFSVIIAGWLIGAVIWFRTLKSAKVSYKDGLKYLFLTLRK